MDIFEAVKAGDVNGVRKLLVDGADVNARDDEQATLLMRAAHAGDLAMVQALLAAGADVRLADALGWTALSKAVYNTEKQTGFPEVVRALIDAGADVEAAIGYGVRPLMLAAGFGQADVAVVLLNGGADVLAKNEGGYTALMMAKQKHYVATINVLHEAEQYAGVGEGSCSTKNAPNSNVVTFLKKPAS